MQHNVNEITGLAVLQYFIDTIIMKVLQWTKTSIASSLTTQKVLQLF